MRFRISLEANSPLAVSREKTTGNQFRTVWRVPGVTWRGALAGHLIRERDLGEYADQDPEFEKLFLMGQVRFGDLRLADRRPWPFSARGCARYDEHPVIDLLAETALGRRPRPVECVESSCDAKLALPREEYFRRDGAGHAVPAGPKRRMQAHTAISGRTLRVRDEQLFSMEAMERLQRFEGGLWCSDGAETSVRRALSGELRIVIGRAGTRGLGDVTLALWERSEGTDEIALMRQRLDELNASFAGVGRVAFTCTLLSPCLVFDELLLARSWIDAADVAEAAGVPAAALEGYEMKACYSRMVTLAGWNAQAGLPKSDVWAIGSGSAFLFVRDFSGSSNVELDRLAPILLKAEEGIGERWEDGLGEAVFCDEFHVKRGLQ